MYFRRAVLASAISAAVTVTSPVFANVEAAADSNMEVIVVTAAGFEQRLIEAPASISVVTAAELQQKSFTNIAEALSSIPGVDVRNGVGKTGGLNIQIRGLPSDYTLILIDGRRQNTSGSIGPNGFNEFSTSFLPPLSAIERIEVIRGPMSTLYGSDAMGGVVNIITKAVATEWGGNLSVDHVWQENRDAADASTFNLGVSGPLAEGVGLQLRGRFFDRGNSERMNPAGTGRDPRPAEGNNYALGGKVTYQLNEQHRIWVDLDTARQKYSNADGRLGTLDTYRADGTPNRIAGYEHELRFYRDQQVIGHRAFLATGTWDTSLSRVVSEQEGRTLPAGNAPAFGYSAIGGEPRTLQNTDIVFDTRFVMPLANHLLSVGFEVKDAEVIDGAAGQGNAFKQDSRSLYAEDEWALRDDLRFTLGGRYEDHSAFGGHFTPRAYIVWNTTEQWTLKTGVSTGYKVPTPNQLHDGVTGFTAQGASVTLGSPTLQPEETINYEVSVNYTDLDKLTLTATVFLNEFKNKLATGPSTPNCLYSDATTPLNRPGCITVGNFRTQSDFSQQINLDKAESRGVEFTTNYAMSDSVTAKATYTWMDTEVKSGADVGTYLVNNPKNQLTASTTWQLTDKFSTWVEAEYKSDRKRFEPYPTSGQNLAIANATDNQLKGYSVLNLGASYRLQDNLRLNAVVYNLQDKDFSQSRAYVWNGNTEYAYLYSHTTSAIGGTYIDGRRLWISLSYDF
ncbi:TonB-dependent receptor domain-containing protein [Alishewanella tabrizica]|uniref:Exogenous ferric siderophore receptor n=1 Tax=Alishewanella tabrizica TaxID=671278 RepID=A0ABQ2WLF5_9ALTE|nr:TonB-dependent receptor [Alishewanella tabrizica]GGW61390.1 exogenous ferric siderophore receptor [Alishewanella tabrizica]